MIYFKMLKINVICFLILGLLTGCSQYIMIRPQNKPNRIKDIDINKYSKDIKIVIDKQYLRILKEKGKYKHIRKIGNKSQLIDQLESTLNQSFNNVSICTGCSQKNNDNVIFIIPKTIRIQLYEDLMDFKDIEGVVTVRYNQDEEHFECYGNVRFQPLTALILFPLYAAECVACVPFAPIFYNTLNPDVFRNKAIINAIYKDFSNNLHDQLINS